MNRGEASVGRLATRRRLTSMRSTGMAPEEVPFDEDEDEELDLGKRPGAG
jgi:hypothetical protein